MVEERLQPLADIDLHPFGIEADADLAIGRFRCRDSLDLAQHALAMVGQRPGEQLTFGVERDLISALR